MPAERPSVAPPRPPMGSASDAEKLIGRIPASVEHARELYRWWRDSDRARGAAKMPLVKVPHRAVRAYGMVGEVPLAEGLMPVFGIEQDVLYYSPKSLPLRGHTIDWLCDQVQAFALRYFMRIASAVRPLQRYERLSPQQSVSPLLQPLSWYPAQTGPEGMGYRQFFYRRKGEEIGLFPPGEQRKIVDVRDVGPIYNWVLLYVHIYDFVLSLSLAGRKGSAALNLPLQEGSYAVLVPDFVADRRNPEPGLAGEFGFGYAIVPNEDPDSLLGYGPSRLAAGIDAFVFRVHDNGEVFLRETFVVNQPIRLLDLNLVIDWAANAADQATLGVAAPLLTRGWRAARQIATAVDPVYSAVDAANALTGGMAGQVFCLSRDRLLREFMVKHCQVELNFFLETMQIWNRFRSWTDESSLPGWVVNP